ncbi:hypothetical protein PLCT1_02661 [Planctomycetaceae bacterium]|nr:hypothetical protein PLCT1_02661 [Planctomycetaceae bacterium]
MSTDLISTGPCPCCDSYAPPEDRGGRQVCPDCGYPRAEAPMVEASDWLMSGEVTSLDEAGWQQLLAWAEREAT